MNSTEKQPIAFPAKTATGKRKKKKKNNPAPGKYSVTKPRKKNVGSYQQLISSIGNKLFPPTMYLSAELAMFSNLEHPGCEVHWEVPSTGSQEERQQPHSPGIAETLTKRKYIRNWWVCLGSLAGCSLPRWFRAVRRAKQRSQTKEVGPEDLWGVPSNPNYFWCRNDDIQSLSLSLLFIYFKIFCSKGFSHRIKNDIAQALHHPLQRLIRTFTVATRLLIPFSNSSVHVLLHKLYTSNLLSGPLLLNSLLILVSLSVDLL